MTGREGAELKGRRYLTEGRLVVTHVVDGIILATCRGDGELHRQRYARDRWACTCPARTDRCAHLVALRLVTAASTSGARP